MTPVSPNAALWLEWLSIAGSIVLFLGYEFWLRRAGAGAPMKMARSAHSRIRGEWVRTVTSRPGTEVLIIQTVRNSVMAASFIASTAALALIGTLTLSGLGGTGSRAFHLDLFNARDLIFDVKVLLLAASFFISFLCRRWRSAFSITPAIS